MLNRVPTSTDAAEIGQAFGEGGPEINYPIRLSVQAQGMLLATDRIDIEPDGRLKLSPFSLASFGNPNADMAARTRVNATTTKLVNKKGGQILSTVTLIVSPDGKTLTITTTGKDAKGQNADSVAVYDKQ